MEMRVELWNGSSYQIVGSDNVDSLRGANIKGVAFSEFSEQRPSAWEVIQPMIESNNGFALFNFTPKVRIMRINYLNSQKKIQNGLVKS